MSKHGYGVSRIRTNARQLAEARWFGWNVSMSPQLTAEVYERRSALRESQWPNHRRDRGPPRLRETYRARPSTQESFIDRHDILGARALQQDLADQNGIRIARASPREVSCVAWAPFQERPAKAILRHASGLPRRGGFGEPAMSVGTTIFGGPDAVLARLGLNPNLTRGEQEVAHRTFFSFNYEEDVWRATNVRNCGALNKDDIEFIDASLWEEAKKKSDAAIQKLIDDALKKSTVTCVLIGANTASRKWVKYEISESVRLGKGLERIDDSLQ